MLRLLCAAFVLIPVLLAACGDGDDGTSSPDPDYPTSLNGATIVPVTPVPKPETVPEAARKIEETEVLGEITRQANATPEGVDTRRLTDAACLDGVLTLQTSEETVYAALPCDRFDEEQVGDAFLGEEIAIVLEATDVRYRVLLETLGGALAEFTVAGIWVE